ncbi:hypothetical protein SARC_07414 [Sphaeroforma arctica JP610]|uniref:Uncharacterized protein n=1 Tax=Sphaeroforma arctica JP610 TaxID=667725 RepID=A0A0L0FTT7_9EUKA|nr:hypothetical protein SARC_07414 [Sphaeroforma arctica JP610]KNC80227.1 hypothetical protein SARC_07414 [Sphaeroforma arctica JP610]|eukprot:XP_014154129.1 hypothetical protein SARC_07414 [Sphaeroforma arctica JP610]
MSTTYFSWVVDSTMETQEIHRPTSGLFRPDTSARQGILDNTSVSAIALGSHIRHREEQRMNDTSVQEEASVTGETKQNTRPMQPASSEDQSMAIILRLPPVDSTRSIDERFHPDSYYLSKENQGHVTFATPYHNKLDQSLELLAPPETMLDPILSQLDKRLQRAVIIVPVWKRAIWLYVAVLYEPSGNKPTPDFLRQQIANGGLTEGTRENYRHAIRIWHEYRTANRILAQLPSHGDLHSFLQYCFYRGHPPDQIRQIRAAINSTAHTHRPLFSTDSGHRPFRLRLHVECPAPEDNGRSTEIPANWSLQLLNSTGIELEWRALLTTFWLVGSPTRFQPNIWSGFDHFHTCLPYHSRGSTEEGT